MSPVCRRCGDPFESDRAWHKHCWRCYRELRDACLLSDRARSAPPSTPPTPPPLELDPRLLLAAIAHTHPDRHPPERARDANAVTPALLELLHIVRKRGDAA